MFLFPASRAKPRQFTPTRRQQGLVQFGNAIDPTLLVNYLGGVVLSNDATTPNTVLDVSAGVCADSTNAALLRVPATTKSTGSAWLPGTGKGGMGKGLTIAASTWYHVFVFNTPAGPDVYFDTSATAANAPAPGLFRRIGSFKTDGSSNILAFTQTGNQFIWAVSIADINTTALGTTATLFTLAGVPTGVKVTALYRGFMADAVVSQDVLVTSPDETSSAVDNVVGNRTVSAEVANIAVAFQLATLTNTSAQIRAVSSNAGNTTTLRTATYGWQDFRGQ